MITDERALRESVDAAKAAAFVAARKKSWSMPVDQETAIILDARLAVLERVLTGMMASFAHANGYRGDRVAKMLAELRDYWEMVAKEISGG